MHARRTLRGFAATLLTAALVAGGALLVAPAGYAEALPDPENGASQVVEPQATEPAAIESEEAGAGEAVSEPVPEEYASQNAAGSSSGGESTAPDPAGDAAETAGSESFSAEPLAQGITAAAPAVSDVSLEASVVAIVSKKSLTVAVEATGFGDGVSEIEAALIERGKEAGLSTEGGYVARAVPSPSVSSGAAEFDLQIEFGELDRTKQYEVLLWVQGESPAVPENVYARVALEIREAQWNELFGTVAVDPAWNAKAAVGSFDWGVKKSFRDYIRTGAAHGTITVQKPATGADVFSYPQYKNTWNPATESGTVSFAGNVNFKGHYDEWYEKYSLYLDLRNPEIVVKSNGKGEIRVVHDKKTIAIAAFDLSTGKKTTARDGAIRYSGIKTELTEAGANTYFANDTDDGPSGFYEPGEAVDDLSFTVGADRQNTKPSIPNTNENTGNNKGAKPKPKPVEPVTTGSGAQAAGSLSWGISSAFASYVTGPIAKGEISTSGVGSSGGAYLFPQAAGGNWNTAAQTGTVQYSGVVTFTGHKGLLSETFSNPVITVTSATSGTISSGGRSFGLDLGSASKSVGANGEVSWSGVPVLGGISGGASGGSQYTLAVDPLSFTVGSASGVSYGSTAVSNASLKRTAADAPPATTGIRVITAAKDLVPGGEIEFEASGFEAKEREILVVLYSDPVVLDEAAGADENGTVRWIGTIPEDTEPGEHTISLQGSIDAGAVITVLDGKRDTKAAAQQVEISADAPQSAPVAAGVVPAGSAVPVWGWWLAAVGLVAVAAAMGGLVARQRRALAQAEAPAPDRAS